MQGLSSNFENTDANKYQYNGKEWQHEWGVDLLDYGARLYGPALGRWNAVDSWASDFPNESPFIYAGNNPIYYVDIGGLYKYPAEVAASYQENYPRLTNYLQNHIQGELMKSNIILKAAE